MASLTSFGMAKHLSDIMYNAVNKCITRDIGMGNYEKQGKQKAAYSIPISFPPMPHQVYKDIGRDEVCQPLWFLVGTTHIKSVWLYVHWLPSFPCDHALFTLLQTTCI